MDAAPVAPRRAVAVLVAAALAAPNAAAAPMRAIGDPPPPTDGRPAAPVTRTVEVPASGFDWEDAGVGAAGMLSLLGLGAGAVAVARRTRGMRPGIS